MGPVEFGLVVHGCVLSFQASHGSLQIVSSHKLRHFLCGVSEDVYKDVYRYIYIYICVCVSVCAQLYKIKVSHVFCFVDVALQIGLKPLWHVHVL